MAAPETYNFTTGSASLPDNGTLSYNGCTFSCLFTSEISGSYIKDEAQRTVKYVEYTLKVDGVATLPDNDDNLAPTMLNLRRLLSQQGGELIYEGRGFDLVVNTTAQNAAINNLTGAIRDVAWGPVPEVLTFQTLGGGGAALVTWQVKVRIPEVSTRRPIGITFGTVPVLQFNYESTINYGEDGFSTIGASGTLEIALTRPAQQTRTLTRTADDVRSAVESRVMSGIDLSKFRVVRREFNLSRDKRTLTWSFQAEEKPYMDLPPDTTVARGTYSVRPAQQGMGLCNWFCTLRCSYVVRADRPRRTAWLAFLLLLRTRMNCAVLVAKEKIGIKAEQNPPKPPVQIHPRRRTAISIFNDVIENAAQNVGINTNVGVRAAEGELKLVKAVEFRNRQADRAMLLDFGFEEGLYLDSKSVTFYATWRLVTQFDNILLASGLWRKLAEDNDAAGPPRPGQNQAAIQNLWALSMRDVQGAKSWLTNQFDPNSDVIIDFGGG